MELSKKLRLNIQEDLLVVNAPANIAEVLPGIPIRTKLDKTKPATQLMLFAYSSDDLHKHLPKLMECIRHDTLTWICYPKQSGAIQSDLIRMQPWEYVFGLGLRGQTSVSVNDDWTGIRLTTAPPKKPSQAELPPEERKVEGIDFVNRTTTLPADAKAVLAQYKSLEDFFNALAFSHRKEHLLAIADAKKPETRANRIQKMAEMLLKQQQEKALKARAKAKK
jgi:hypothetical protein